MDVCWFLDSYRLMLNFPIWITSTFEYLSNNVRQWLLKLVLTCVPDSINNPYDIPTWDRMVAIKTRILRMWDTAQPGIRICCMKFAQRVVLVQTTGPDADSKVWKASSIWSPKVYGTNTYLCSAKWSSSGVPVYGTSKSHTSPPPKSRSRSVRPSR